MATINGRKFGVTLNPENALRAFRVKCNTTPAVLWADAICINQEDPEEREHQVSMMNEVYQKASTVRIWLGLGNAAMIRGLDIMERFSLCECGGIRATRII